ncbi:GGDEF domain-containing protein [Thioflexithrix psekupsensis]|uniref:cyclic-guanylate-specific phosphodiesterase n=1 Tax=Thioflexithrix psekupsensis TaxID=1570016 RepID=A0A251X6G6_9GAMM|nr:GGDEF domain-containing protein [Thioflexithrix psekupsensis]
MPRYRLTTELKKLASKLEEFEQERLDLEAVLLTTTEHGDLIETALFNELRQFRLRLEQLEQEHKGLEREKTDLEIALETVTETTDLFQKDLLKTRHILEQEVNKRTEELALQNQRLQAEIQERKRIEADLQLAASVFRTSREGIVIMDAERRVISVNPAFTDLTGYVEAEMLGTDLSRLQSGQHSQTFFHNLWEAVHFVGYWSGEVWHRRKTEEAFPTWFSLTVIHDDQGNIVNYIGILTDNTYQKRSEERAYYFAHYDALTNLPNRNLFQDRLEQAIKRAIRENHHLSLLVIDLDSFKDINEVFGHQVGDQLLKEIGQRLVKCLQEKDELIARLGSDEFVIVFDELPADERLVQITLDKADNVLMAIQRPLQLLDQELSVSACGGLAFYPRDGQNLVELLRRANANLYEAKRQGYNNYHYFAGPMNAQTKKRLTLQHHLRYALEREELFLLYQPQVDIHSRKIAGVEALLRWQHPEFGLISPSEFIPIVEDIGLIVPVGEWVLSSATRQAQRWLAQGLSPVRMAVNLSMRQFNDPLLLQRVHRALLEAQLAPHYLELEITESLAMQDAEKTVTTLRQLKQLGVFLALDDFGTGYSSLSYLSQFPLDVLKIDAAFIGKIQTPNGANLVSAITTLARSLRMDVIAEGVETKAQLNCLQRYACDYVQGFYFYKPMPAHELTVLLQQQC